MEQFQINSPKDFVNIIDSRREEIKNMVCRQAQEIVDNELNLLEFNLCISLIGKEKINKATKKVNELREKADRGEIDLSKYEDMAEDF